MKFEGLTSLVAIGVKQKKLKHLYTQNTIKFKYRET